MLTDEELDTWLELIDPLSDDEMLRPVMEQAKLANRYRAALERIATQAMTANQAHRIAAKAMKEVSNAP